MGVSVFREIIQNHDGHRENDVSSMSGPHRLQGEKPDQISGPHEGGT